MPCLRFVNRQKYTLAFLRFVKYRHCQFCPTPPLVRSSPRGKISSRQNWGKNCITEPPCIIQSGQQYKIQKLCNSLIMEAPWPGAAVDRCFDIFIISSRPRSLERDDICKVTTKKKIQHFSDNSCKWTMESFVSIFCSTLSLLCCNLRVKSQKNTTIGPIVTQYSQK